MLAGCNEEWHEKNVWVIEQQQYLDPSKWDQVILVHGYGDNEGVCKDIISRLRKEDPTTSGVRHYKYRAYPILLPKTTHEWLNATKPKE